MSFCNKSPSSTVISPLVSVSLLILLACLIHGFAVTPTLAQTPESAALSPAPEHSSPVVNVTQELRLSPDTPGEITVVLHYTLPPQLVNLTAWIPEEATVTSTTGFRHSHGTEYVWDNQTAHPSLTYRLPVNETERVTGPLAGSGTYVFVDAGPWALVEKPQAEFEYYYTGDQSVNWSQQTTVAESGVVGDHIAFLGDYRSHTQTDSGQTFRLIVPRRASLSDSPSNIFDSVAMASRELDVGRRDEQVLMIAVPTKSINWAYAGQQWGESDFWVRDNETVDSAYNVWVHEYVHTRQDYTADTGVAWFTEASASYYAALLTLEQDRIDFAAFRAVMELGTVPPDSNAILADPSTWNGQAHYTKGALVAGELDRTIRLSTDGAGSLQAVFAEMNRREDTVTASAFRAMVGQTGGATAVEVMQEYTTTKTTPPVWSVADHSDAFGYTLASRGTVTDEPTPTPGEAGPGFGLLIALGAVLLGSVLVFRGMDGI